MSPQILQAIAAIIAAFAGLTAALYGVVTRPMLGRMDSMQSAIQAQINDIIVRLGRIETKIDNHTERIAKLEASKWR
jgi:hypothetical protein